MLKRLGSFLKSDSKQAVLNYYLHELKGNAARYIHRNFFKTRSYPDDPERRINLSGEIGRNYGAHRSGWQYAVKNIMDLHTPKGVVADTFTDRTFAADARRRITYSEPWIGFIHIPPRVPEWMNSPQSNSVIFDSGLWKRSEPYCRGLFTLSEYHRNSLSPLFNFPVENLLHPTEFPKLTWTWNRFTANPDKKIIQTGWWLRRVYSIYLLEVQHFRKAVLLKQDANVNRHMKLELENMKGNHRITSRVLDSVTRLNFLSNQRYDELLAENIVFLDLYDASANNAVIECIARNTPVLVNPLPPVVEYLGRDYPFYFNSLEEAAMKAENMELVHETHTYLVNHPLKYKLSGEYFRRSFIDSAIYCSL